MFKEISAIKNCNNVDYSSSAIGFDFAYKVFVILSRSCLLMKSQKYEGILEKIVSYRLYLKQCQER